VLSAEAEVPLMNIPAMISNKAIDLFIIPRRQTHICRVRIELAGLMVQAEVQSGEVVVFGNQAVRSNRGLKSRDKLSHNRGRGQFVSSSNFPGDDL
jgi:hypothetical protein